MAELDLEFLGTFNIDTRKVCIRNVDNICFYNTDKNIGKLYFTLLKQDDNNLSVYLDKAEVANYTIELIVIKPDNTKAGHSITGVLQEGDHVTYLFEISNDLTDVVGDCICELRITEGDKILTSQGFKYYVKSNTPVDTTVNGNTIYITSQSDVYVDEDLHALVIE